MDCDNIGEILKINNGLGVELSRPISLSKEPKTMQKSNSKNCRVMESKVIGRVLLYHIEQHSCHDAKTAYSPHLNHMSDRCSAMKSDLAKEYIGHLVNAQQP
uniref:Uncharacterized protein n=1 Tax=Yersinia pestis TaxID=632 RepID=E7E580_YERPE|nr:hypothetical protein [Yersinia pestis]